MKLDSTNIRFGSRVPHALAVHLSVDARTAGRGTIRNASISGALIETALDLPLHTNLVLTLSMAVGEVPATRSLAACVVRVDPDGVGIEWRDIAGADVLDLLERASNLEAVRALPAR
ncbi:MAG TPA: PilZ domain-containing protein [Steroidobacteraceae bacterium]|nr:PilZ domain-containing protein [Steroidobacteraceae bacterium]